MIYSITATNYLGESIELELARPESSGFLVKSVTGAGPPQANINITEIATVDGGIFNSSRARTKNIVLQLIFWPKDASETIEDIRHRSYKYFQVKKSVTLLFRTDNRTSYIVGFVEKNEPNIWDRQEGCQISIICDTPWLKDTSQNNVVFSGVRPMLFFPFYNNLVNYTPSSPENYNERHIIMGEIVKKFYYDITYEGEVETGINIIMHLTAPVNGITIYNVTTNERMFVDGAKVEEFTGTALRKNDEIVICTVQGQRSAKLLRNGKYTNIFNCISTDSSWFQLVKGVNQFAYTTVDQEEDQASSIVFQIVNDILYTGI